MLLLASSKIGILALKAEVEDVTEELQSYVLESPSWTVPELKHVLSVTCLTQWRRLGVTESAIGLVDNLLERVGRDGGLGDEQGENLE